MIDWNSIAKKFKEADAILIGASNGLSITEGLHLFADNAAFERLFGDFKQKYGLGCILQGMMAGWPSEEEKWAFWTRLIHHYCGQYQPTPVMNDLKAIVGEKDYFVVMKPIILLPKKGSQTLAPSIAPGNPSVGVMLPYTPLHLLLFIQKYYKSLSIINILHFFLQK